MLLVFLLFIQSLVRRNRHTLQPSQDPKGPSLSGSPGRSGFRKTSTFSDSLACLGPRPLLQRTYQLLVVCGLPSTPRKDLEGLNKKQK